ncbi:MAG: DNA-directed RNA polymerase subunit omega [Gemmatimonadetes bacterium]|nr:DNA-directed RNA polymerase subunit omega [Gemmatimonadota bacterium]
MRVFTPDEAAAPSGSKYEGVLVAARFARELNALPKETMPITLQKKLTTRAIEALVNGELDYELVKRRRRGAQ